MISVEEATERILSYVHVLGLKSASARGAWPGARRDVVSDMDIPPLDNTAMDGYAVRSADTAGARSDKPVTLRVQGELAAGYVFEGEVTAGGAVRIMTGAPCLVAPTQLCPSKRRMSRGT